jgi:hypothetical protein
VSVDTTSIGGRATVATERRILPTGPAGARQLARDLRRLIPARFTWDYSTLLGDKNGGKCGCACAYIAVTYPGLLPKYSYGSWLELLTKHLRMSKEEGSAIFMQLPERHSVAWSEVTPEMVADAIDDWLRSRGEPTSEEIKE